MPVGIVVGGEHREEGVAGDIVAVAEGGFFRAVNLGDLHLALQASGDFLPDGSQLLAMSTPRRVELDDPVVRSVNNLFAKRFAIEHDNIRVPTFLGAFALLAEDCRRSYKQKYADSDSKFSHF